MSPIRLCWLLALCQVAAWAAPIHQQVAESPLMYMRIPVLWDRPELNQMQEKNLSSAIMNVLTEPGKQGNAVREVVAQLKGSIEFLALPPSNRFLPVPGLALRASYTGSPEDMANKIQKLIISSVETIQGTSADWLKFKRTVKGTTITDAAFLLGRMTLVTEPDQFTLYFSQSNPEFPKLFTAKSKLDIEAGKASKHEDAVLYVDVEKSMSFYKDWLAKVAKPTLDEMERLGIVDLKKIELWTEGESESFKTKGRVELNNVTTSRWGQLSSAQKANVEFPDSGSFKGAMLWPKLKSTEWMNHLSLFKTMKASDKALYAKLFESVQGPVSFSWVKSSIAPLISMQLSSSKNFELTLAKILSPIGGKITKEAGTSIRNVIWKNNSVSYKIDGNKLTFSPLLQALRDQKSSSDSSVQSQLVNVEYPLEGQVSGNYYSIMHLVIQMAVGANKAMDPKVFPPFSSMSIKDRAWSAEGSLQIVRDKNHIELSWNQPFGLPGLLSGVKLPSSSWLYFLSLASLTSNSVKF